MIKNIRLEDWEAEQMKDPEFRTALEDLEPAYQVARLRMEKGLTQAQLAELVGTKQSSIARLESGVSQPRLSFLRRVIKALNGQMKIEIISEKEVARQQAVAHVAKEVNVSFSIQSVRFPGAGRGNNYPSVNLKSPSARHHQEEPLQ